MKLTLNDAVEKAASLGAAAWMDGNGRVLLIRGRLTAALLAGLDCHEARAFFGTSAMSQGLPQAEGYLSLERIRGHVLALFTVVEGRDGDWLVQWLKDVHASFT